MPYSIKFDLPPIGYSLESAKTDERVNIVCREFTSSEDGDFFIKRLEGFPSQVISLLPERSGVKASTVDNLVVIVDKEGNATVYVNELSLIAHTRVRKAFNKGDPIFEDDIVDINKLEFEGLEVANDVGFLIVFSKGWRKGLFYDFAPLLQPPQIREYDLWSNLGHYYNYLLHQDYFKITDTEWQQLFVHQWFPFISLKRESVLSLLSHIRSGWSVDEILNRIVNEVEEFLPSALIRWKELDTFRSHVSLFEKAAERFVDKDYVSATAILFPRIEGLLRDINTQNGDLTYSQKTLSKASEKALGLSEERYSRILPTKFREYLSDVYFANFQPNVPKGISRNSVGHGVAEATSFSAKSAAIGFLIIEQIYFHIPPKLVNNL